MAEFTRRSILLASGACLGNVGYGAATRSLIVAASAQDQAANGQSIEHWMDQSESSHKSVSGPLLFGRFADPIYFLLKSVTWQPNPGQEQFNSVTVPVGFVTDFSSTPRVFWSTLRPDSTYTYPALIHDYLYWVQDIPRENADDIFKLSMNDVGIGTRTATILYNAVRFGGDNVWNKNARLKTMGEKRVLRRFPENPNIKWTEWKKQPDVFG
jgi:hypothetical protein